MAEVLTPDVCVIGAGSAGLSLAAAAAQMGLSVVLIEEGRMGGDCLNFGCVPSKALLAAAMRAHLVERAHEFGVMADPAAIDFGAVMEHVREVVAAIAPNDSVERFTGLGVKVIQAHGEFVSPREVEADGVRIAARRFVVASGSAPAVPPIPGLAETEHFTNETIFDNRKLPDHLLVLGAGPIGLELAQAHRRLGSRVTVIEAAEPMAGEDPEQREVLLNRLAREGVAVRHPVKALAVDARGDQVALRLDAGDDGPASVSGSHLLVATGRAPVVEGLGLDRAGIEYSRGGIVVNAALRTTNKAVYAIGDVAGQGQFTHLANHHAGLVLRSILTRWPARTGRHPIPRVIYTDPELAWVGMSEAAALRRRRGVTIQRWPLAENDRAHAERQTHGMIKVIAGRGGRILGAGIVGAHAGELIEPWILAIDRGLKMSAMTGWVLPYPTLGEVSKRAAFAYYGSVLMRSSLPRLLRGWMRLF